ncbi:MAG: zinc ribbon domain-containing protein [Firmicutes bacterium]|nr:zinc ribbon domain-containing protein [Bacillota bacterium]
MEQAKYCTNCGKGAAADANYCSRCGYDINPQVKSGVSTRETVSEAAECLSKIQFTKFYGYGAVTLLMLVVEGLKLNVMDFWMREIVCGMRGMRAFTSTLIFQFLVVVILEFAAIAYMIKFSLMVYPKKYMSLIDLITPVKELRKTIRRYFFTYALIAAVNLCILICAILIMEFLVDVRKFTAIYRVPTLMLIAIYIINTKLILSPFLALDQNLHPSLAIKEGMRLTKGHNGEMLGWALIIFILNGIGTKAVIGTAVTIPISVYLLTRMYYKLRRENPNLD